FLPPAGEKFRHFLSHLAILREIVIGETVTFAVDSHETAKEILCFSSCASKRDLGRFGQTAPGQRWRSWRGAMCLRCTPARGAGLAAWALRLRRCWAPRRASLSAQRPAGRQLKETRTALQGRSPLSSMVGPSPST